MGINQSSAIFLLGPCTRGSLVRNCTNCHGCQKNAIADTANFQLLRIRSDKIRTTHISVDFSCKATLKWPGHSTYQILNTADNSIFNSSGKG